MKLRVCSENTEAKELIPPSRPDGSGIGVNFADAYIKAMNVELEDGRKVACKRKGLKILLSVGDRAGEGLLRRMDKGPDVKNILRSALAEAAEGAGVRFSIEEGVIFLEE